MRWIKKEISSTDHEAFWVGRFKKQNTALAQHSQSLIYKLNNGFKGEMFNQMEGGHAAQAIIWACP